MVQYVDEGRVLVVKLITGELVCTETAKDKINPLWKEPLLIWIGKRETGERATMFRPLCIFTHDKYIKQPDLDKWVYFYEASYETKEARRAFLERYYDALNKEEVDRADSRMIFSDFTITH